MASKGKSQYLVCPPFAHLELFLETVLKFSSAIFWYIILGFLQYLFFFRLILSFSVQVIPYCLYNSQVWTLWRPVHDCQSFISCPNMISLALAVCLGSL